MRRFVRNFLVAILFLVFYFALFINFAPQIESFIESFVEANKDIFKIQFKTVEFEYNTTTNVIDQIEKYITIDLSILLIFILKFALYVFIPFMSIFILVRG